MKSEIEIEIYEKIETAFVFLNSILAAIGIISNLLVFVVFQRKRVKCLSFSIYFKVMAISDICVLLHTYRTLVSYILGFQIEHHPFLCQFTEYSKIVPASISCWLLSLIAFDRMRSIVFSSHLEIFKNIKFQIFLTLVIIVGSLCLFSPIPLFYEYTSYTFYDVEYKYCVIDGSKYLIIFLVSLSNWIVSGLVINNVLSIIMIVFIFKSRRKVSSFLSNDMNNRNKIKDRKFAISSIILNITCLVLKSPYFFSYCFLNQINTYKGALVFWIFNLLFTIDSSSCFTINMFVNTIFYSEFMKILKTISQKIRYIYVSFKILFLKLF